jgi:hypothetical protein
MTDYDRIVSLAHEWHNKHSLNNYTAFTEAVENVVNQRDALLCERDMWGPKPETPKPPQYPKWFLVEDFGVERVDDQKYGVIFGRRLNLSTPQSRHAIRAHCTREQAVERLAQIVRDPVVAWDGYKARVWPTYSGYWGWDASRDKEAVAHGYAPTEPAARLALAGWLLDNTCTTRKEKP